MKTMHYDAVIIGFGKGGKTLAGKHTYTSLDDSRIVWSQLSGGRPYTAADRKHVPPDGLLKAIIDKDTGKILGAMLLCEESYEMINVIKPAIDMDADYTVLRDQLYTHPAMTEALNDLFAV